MSSNSCETLVKCMKSFLYCLLLSPSFISLREPKRSQSIDSRWWGSLPAKWASLSNIFLWATLSRLLLKTLVGSGDYFLVCLLAFVVVDGIFFSYFNSSGFGRIFLFQSSSLSLIKCHRMSVKNLNVSRVVGTTQSVFLGSCKLPRKQM